jgi:hypothetical protein
LDYQRAVEGAVRQGVEKLGFTIDQAIGYAHDNLELKLDNSSDDLPLVMTALSMIAVKNGTAVSYQADDEFVQRLKEAYSPERLLSAISRTAQLEQMKLIGDVEVVKKAFKL